MLKLINQSCSAQIGSSNKLFSFYSRNSNCYCKTNSSYIWSSCKFSILVSRNALKQSPIRLNDVKQLRSISNTPPVRKKINFDEQSQSGMWERDRKSGYGEEYDTTEEIRAGLKDMRLEFIKWKHEVHEKFMWDPIIVFPGSRDPVWQFDATQKKSEADGSYPCNAWNESTTINPITSENTRHDIKESDSQFHGWMVSTDQDHGQGHSSAKLTASPAGHALFSGNLSTQLVQDGQVTYSGYCNMSSLRPRRSFGRDSFYEWTMYTHLIIRCRGDGRSYLLNLASAGSFDVSWNDVFSYILYTRGGPHWQTYKVPFSKFYLSSKGNIQDKQQPIDSGRVTSLGISVSDTINAPFRLEIDSIAVECDPVHSESFAYELYAMPNFYL